MPLRPLAVLAAALLLAACGRTTDPAPAPADPYAAEPGPYTAEELVGTWELVEQAGAPPDYSYTLTFTAEGDYVLRDNDGDEDRRTYQPSGPDRIEVVGGEVTDVEHYVYDVQGNTLTLTIPGTEAVTVFQRAGSPAMTGEESLDAESAY